MSIIWSNDDECQHGKAENCGICTWLYSENSDYWDVRHDLAIEAQAEREEV